MVQEFLSSAGLKVILKPASSGWRNDVLSYCNSSENDMRTDAFEVTFYGLPGLEKVRKNKAI